MDINIRQAGIDEAIHISSVLTEVAEWQRSIGAQMWRGDELSPERLAADVTCGEFFVAVSDGKITGTIKFKLEDELFWPDLPTGEAAFVHRLAVRRAFAGGKVSTALLTWAAARARSIGRSFLRLDCEASRPRLRAVYERFGFRHHSDRQVGPYFVSRYELKV